MKQLTALGQLHHDNCVAIAAQLHASHAQQLHQDQMTIALPGYIVITLLLIHDNYIVAIAHENCIGIIHANCMVTITCQLKYYNCFSSNNCIAITYIAIAPQLDDDCIVVITLQLIYGNCNATAHAYMNDLSVVWC